MFCHKCGAQVDDQAAFCDKCGAALTNMRPMVSVIPAAQPAPVAAPPPAYPVLTEYAGFWKRFAAALLDGLLLFAAYMALCFILGLFYGLSLAGEEADVSEDTMNLLVSVAWIFTFLLGWLYYALMEGSSRQATLGKMALGIVVTDMDGRRISFGRATGRYFAKIISGIILYIGYIMIAFTGQKQGLHDIMAGCLVVVKKPAVPQQISPLPPGPGGWDGPASRGM